MTIKMMVSGGPLVHGVRSHVLRQLPDGTILSIGGRDPNDNVVGWIQEYDAEAQTWSLRQETMVVPKSASFAMVPEDWCNLNNI